MHFGIIDELFSDPRGTLIVLLLALPGRMLAISAHEAAHGWVANRCGDPTAKSMGRVTLNPLKHLDPIGLLCFLFLGIGWAKPVPVNPRNYRNGRKDDLKVSMAGICMNLLLFLSGLILLYGLCSIALARVPLYENISTSDTLARHVISGTPALITTEGWYSVSNLLANVPWLSELLITPVFGRVFGYVYSMLGYFVSTNLVLAVFNLLPIPPLDGYHLMNDLTLKRSFFAEPKTQRICMLLLYIGIFTGVLSSVLDVVYTFVLTGLGKGALALMCAGGLF